MSRINISNLSFSYPDSADYVFKDVSFCIDSSWRLGFCGRNGRGKTTFLRLLMGEFEYSGTISTDLSFDYFPFSTKNDDDLTIDVTQSIAPNAQNWEILKELNRLGLDENTLYRPFNTLSSGEQTKARLTALFLRQNNFLLIDEPTNHLDLEARQITADYLKSKSGFILVSHDRAFLDACTDHTLSINKTGIEVTKGSFSTWFEQKSRADKFEADKNERLEGEIDRLKRSSLQSEGWSNKAERAKFEPQKSGLSADRGFLGKKAAKMMKHAKSIQKRQAKAIEEKSSLLKNVENVPSLRLMPLEHTNSRLVTISNLSLFYDERKVFDGFNMIIDRGERVALTGGNGSGKSSILKLIAGLNISYFGTFNTAQRLKISYVPQDTSHLNGLLSDYAKKYEISEPLLKSMLHKLGLSALQTQKDLSEFSLGQKKKVLIARSLLEQAHLYVWDEPLNYIDIYSRIQIENMLLSSCPTLIFTEHDKMFKDKIATQTTKLLTI